jgi:uncharacterized membrane protein YeaQ/YmgE (transglycosylase-associated protein family)
MADATNVMNAAMATAADLQAEKRKKIIKYVLIAVIGAVVLWFVYKKFIK